MRVQIPGSFTHYTRSVTRPFHRNRGIGIAGGLLSLHVCAGIGGPHCWRVIDVVATWVLGLWVV